MAFSKQEDPNLLAARRSLASATKVGHLQTLLAMCLKQLLVFVHGLDPTPTYHMEKRCSMDKETSWYDTFAEFWVLGAMRLLNSLGYTSQSSSSFGVRMLYMTEELRVPSMANRLSHVCSTMLIIFQS